MAPVVTNIVVVFIVFGLLTRSCMLLIVILGYSFITVIIFSGKFAGPALVVCRLLLLGVVLFPASAVMEVFFFVRFFLFVVVAASIYLLVLMLVVIVIVVFFVFFLSFIFIA